MERSDFVLEFTKRIHDVAKRYKASPDAVFAVEIEIVGLNYIMTTGGHGGPDAFDQSRPNIDLTAIMTAKGVLAELKEKGVTRDNALEYAEKRLARFESDVRVCRGT